MNHFHLMIRMDTRQLRMFIAIAHRGSLVAAARDLHLTASALSHGLKALETHIGCRLLDRIGKKVQLNQAGEQLLAQVEKPLAELDRAEEGVKRLGKWGQMRLRVGASSSACEYILPGVIRELKKTFSNLSLQVESGDMPAMTEMIQQNRIDLAIGVPADVQQKLELRHLFRDELLFTFAPSHPWASAKAIPKNEISTQPLILYQRASVTAQLVTDYFRTEGLAPLSIMEVANTTAIKELVKLGLGVAILAPWAAESELKRRVLLMRPIGARPLYRQWSIACLAGRRLNLIEETFCRLCRKWATGLRTDRRDLPA